MPIYKIKAGHFSKAGSVGPAPDYLWTPGESYGPGDTVELTEDEAKGLGHHRFVTNKSGLGYGNSDSDEEAKLDPTDAEWEKVEFNNVDNRQQENVQTAIVTVIPERAPIAEPVPALSVSPTPIVPAVSVINPWASVAGMSAEDVRNVVANAPDSATLDIIELAEKGGKGRVTVLDAIRTKRARMGWN